MKNIKSVYNSRYGGRERGYVSKVGKGDTRGCEIGRREGRKSEKGEEEEEGGRG